MEIFKSACLLMTSVSTGVSAFFMRKYEKVRMRNAGCEKEGVRDMYGRVKRTFQTYKELLLLGLLGIPIGLVVGGIDAVLGRVLLAITDFGNGHPTAARIPFLALAGALIAFCYLKNSEGRAVKA